MTVLYDLNEAATSNRPLLIAKVGVRTTRVDLKVGDYVIGDVGIEVKEIADYLGSLRDGSLNNQLYDLSHDYDLSYLIVIGLVSGALMKAKMTRQAYLSSLFGSSFKRSPDGRQGQIVTVNVETDYDFALGMKFLDEKWQKDEPRVPVVRTSNFVQDEQLRVLMGVDGVGPTTAKAVLSMPRTDTIRKVFTADKETLMLAPGVGDKTSEAIEQVSTRRYEG